MKIGIITQPLSRNYGGILQNYALQQTLKRLGHEPYTFDFKVHPGWGRWLKQVKRVILKGITGRKAQYMMSPWRFAKMESYLRRFAEEHISLVSPRMTLPTEAKVREYGFEALISGSDQVWRPMYNRSITNMYLEFAAALDVKRIAYAASFGTDEWEYNERQEAACRALAQGFDAVSVREESGVRLCKEHFGIEAKHVLDPTMLLTATEYNTLLSNIPVAKDEYILAYILDMSPAKLAYINNIANKIGVRVVMMGVENNITRNDSIERWLSLFRDAKYVITDSFHGCIFSLIYNIDFQAIGNIDRGLARMTSVLRLFDLTDRLIDESHIDKYVDNAIDWHKINAQMEELRSESLAFLRDALSNSPLARQ